MLSDVVCSVMLTVVACDRKVIPSCGFSFHVFSEVEHFAFVTPLMFIATPQEGSSDLHVEAPRMSSDCVPRSDHTPQEGLQGGPQRRTVWFVCETWSHSWRERLCTAESVARREIQDVEQFLAEKLLRPRRLDFADKWRPSATRDH